MIFLFYYFNRINLIFAKYLSKNYIKENFGFKNLYINLFLNKKNYDQFILKFLKENMIFKTFFINFFLKKNIFFKKKNKKKKFFKKAKLNRPNYFKNKLCLTFIFKENFFNQLTFFKNKSFFFNFFNFFLIFKFFFCTTLNNYFKLFLNINSEKLKIFFFFLYLKKNFKNNQNKIVSFVDVKKIKDFWFTNRLLINNNVIYTLSSIIEDSFLNLSSIDYAVQDYVPEKKFYRKNLFLNSNVYFSYIVKDRVDWRFLSKEDDFYFVNKINIDFFKINFFRLNKLYNKGKFSRNRQTYRTGVFLCIWLTILTVIGMYFYFYTLSIKFTYFYFGFIFFIFLFFYKYIFKFNKNKMNTHFFF